MSSLPLKTLSPNICKTYRIITVMGANRLEAAMKIRLGNKITTIVFKLIKLISTKCPTAVIKFFPKSLCSLFGSCAYLEGASEEICFAWADKAFESKFKGHKKAALFIKANYIYKHYSELEAKQKFNDIFFMSPKIKEDNFDHFALWSWHNNSQSGHSEFIKKVVTDLSNQDHLFDESKPHYLPEHTTNMGHLGALFLYSNFYRRVEPNRFIALWPDCSPNKYYLKELLKILPFKIQLIPGRPIAHSVFRNQIDTLSYSRIKPGKWRFESLTDFPNNQHYPEYDILEEFTLKSDENLSNFANEKLKSIGFNQNKWFICLHVKENYLGYKHGGETRDASIESYRNACNEINALGGQVIRMGFSNFPRLDSNFPAIDYAHSEVRSEELDFWLWANCKFWVGTSNGAAVSVIPFRKPRLLTNTWPLNASGPNQDFFLPKLVYCRNRMRFLTPREVIDNKFSRTMKRELLERAGLDLVDNSSKLISESIVEMNQHIDSKFAISKTYSEFEQEVYTAMNLAKHTPKMKIPLTFRFAVEV